MPETQPSLWGASDAYEQYMGRWSRNVAPLFLSWVDAPSGASWIDIGCGTGVLTSTILSRCEPMRVVGIDSSEVFLQAAQHQVADPRVSFRQGNALAIHDEDHVFDNAVSGLVLNFVPDPEAAVREMVRVVKPSGMVALYVWDYAGHMQVMRHFFDAANALDPKAKEFDDGIKAPICRPGPLQELFERAGLADVAVLPIDIPTAFDNFDDYWGPFLGGTGSAPKYCMSLGEPERERLREIIRGRLPTGPDGEILLAVRAWGVKGRVAR